MSSIVRILRRVNGAAGSPSAAGRFEGELAANMPGAAGIGTTVQLWAFDGVAWRRANPDPSISVTSKTIPGTNTPWADGNAAAPATNEWPWVVSAGQVPIVTHNGSAYAFTGGVGSYGTTSGGTPLAAGMFTALGAASQPPQLFDFDTNSQVQAGNPANIGEAYALFAAPPGNGSFSGDPVFVKWGGDTYVLVNPAVPSSPVSYAMVSSGVPAAQTITLDGMAGNPSTIGSAFAVWDAMPGNDLTGDIVFASFKGVHYVLTDAANPNSNGSWSPISEPAPTALTYRGNLDVTAAYVAPTPAWSAGDFATVQVTGAPHASWAAVGLPAANPLTAGDLLVWDGTNFHPIANEASLSAYLALAGGTMADGAGITFNTTSGQAGPGAATVIIIDGNGGSVDNVVIDSGTF